MTDSVDVLNMLKLVYTLYTLAVISLIGWFALGVVNPKGKPRILKPATFYTYVGALITVGVAIHIVTFNKIPWVEIDFKRSSLTPKQVVNITIEKHEFKLPSPKIELECNEYVLFDVVSKDITYGFGIFRQNNSMVTQMQVVPGSKNDLMWKFGKNGVYHLRSTEYSGPKGANMYIKDVFEVKGCAEDDKYSQKGGSL
ncbi:MAG: cytochrome C oxidase subunit II [Sulfurimonas sp.]|uniref:cytochrome C oxidase subunit II n=1 Tax=Sulfurimonas sp. TaxID=2022749 RepID=UPI002608D3E8|nr:cytochrome C oxidase subunit II [Sulfurimonas sp.]MDD5372836.1 cytochrome C oxidase subunit II [Sulfurimonas sp.]